MKRISTCLYNTFISPLIVQSAKPSGFIGRRMLKIWNRYFTALDLWCDNYIEYENITKALYIGFGSGTGVKHMHNKNPQSYICGIDLSPEAVHFASTLNKDGICSGQISLQAGNAASLPFADDSFDFIMAAQTHIYWDQLEKGLKESYRTLKKEGIFFIACEADKIRYHLSEYINNNNFAELLLQTGFHQMQVESNNKYVAFICAK